MPYNLPQAVLALLQQEGSRPQPKAYFVRSGSKSTKITLVYSKRKRRGVCDDFGMPIIDRSSPSPMTGSQIFSVCQSRSAVPGVVSSPPFSKHILNDGYAFPQRPTCPTEASTTTTTSSREERGMSARGRDGYEFNTTPDDDEDDDDLSDHYIALSPSLSGDDTPLTPGRDFDPSTSPRPPTPNIQNYNILMASAKTKKGPGRLTPSRQPTIEYNEETSLPVSDNVGSVSLREDAGDHHQRPSSVLSQPPKFRQFKGPKSQKQTSVNAKSDGARIPNSHVAPQQQQQPSSKKAARTPAGVAVAVAKTSPDQQRCHQQHQRSHSDRRHDAEHSRLLPGSRPSYQRGASWDSGHP